MVQREDCKNSRTAPLKAITIIINKKFDLPVSASCSVYTNNTKECLPLVSVSKACNLFSRYRMMLIIHMDQTQTDFLS